MLLNFIDQDQNLCYWHKKEHSKYNENTVNANTYTSTIVIKDTELIMIYLTVI